MGDTKREREPGFSSPRPIASFPIDGSTATVVLIVGDKLYLANCGDSAGKQIQASLSFSYSYLVFLKLFHHDSYDIVMAQVIFEFTSFYARLVRPHS